VHIDLFQLHPQTRQSFMTLFSDDLLNSFIMSSRVSVQKG
jgi:hypothetical protein